MNHRAAYCSYECKLARPTSGGRRFRILARDGFRCIYCGHSSIEDASALHVDHVVPEAAGGSSDDLNLATACMECNEGKRAHRLPADVEARVLAVVAARSMPR